VSQKVGFRKLKPLSKETLNMAVSEQTHIREKYRYAFRLSFSLDCSQKSCDLSPQKEAIKQYAI